MVQPNENPESPSGSDVVNNIIDQASADLDRELDSTQPQPPTAEQVRELQAQISQTQAENRGLQGMLDKAVNAIRRDSENRIDERFRQMQQAQQNQDYLNSLDPREREVQEPMLEKLNNLERQVVTQQTMPQGQPQPQPQPQTSVESQWEQVYRIVEGMGLNRNDPNVNYAVLTDNTKTDAQKEQMFYASVSTAVAQRGQPTPQAPVTQAVDPQVQTPPVENGRQGSAEGAQNLDQLMDWWLPLQNPTEQQKEDYRRKLDQFQQ